MRPVLSYSDASAFRPVSAAKMHKKRLNKASTYIAQVHIRTPRSLASCISFADFSTASASSATPTSTKRAYAIAIFTPQIGTGRVAESVLTFD
jgi:hypothetical protein